ncbi:MAG: DUF2807 domain-containing protein, partial [Spirochaetales bacterium]|nr:DUF2807 domain-containing protein [Spirochaetales bacterium]
MRTSNKILIILAAVILVGLIILAASFRGFAGRVMKDAPPEGTGVTGSGARVERTYEVEDFTGIESSGGWEVVVTQGNRYEVKVTAPENIHDVLRISRKGDNLVLGFEPGYTVSNARTSAVIYMPELRRLSGTGGTAFTFNGFSGERLDIEIAGGATLHGTGGRYD